MAKNWAKVILIIVLTGLLILALFRHSLCRFLIYRASAKATGGLRLTIKDLNLDLLHSSLTMRDVTLFNPAGFEDKILAQVKQIFIQYDLLGSLGKGWHIRQAKVDISEINSIKNESGISNVASLRNQKNLVKPPTQQPVLTSPTQNKPKQTTSRRPKFLIDHLEVSLEKATVINYAAKIGEPAVIVFMMKGPYHFHNVSDLEYVAESLSKDTLGNNTN